MAALVTYLLIDDLFALHELSGKLFPGSSTIGEVIPSLVAGAAFLVWGMYRVVRSDGATRTLLILFGLTIAYIAFFGVVVDGLHGLFIAPFSPLDGPITVVEDGNELIGIAFLATLLGKHCPEFGTALGTVAEVTHNI